MPLLRLRTPLGRWAPLLAGLLSERFDPLFGGRDNERLAARIADENLLPEFLPQAIELLVHLPLLPSSTVEIRFVSCVRRDEHDDASRRAAACPAATLDCPDLGGGRFVKENQIHMRNIQGLFTDVRRSDDV